MKKEKMNNDHKIPLGQVVEVEIDDGFGVDNIFYGKDYQFPKGSGLLKKDEGIDGDKEIVLRFKGNLRTLVVGHSRDCDGTPLYALSNIRVKYNYGELETDIKAGSELYVYKMFAKYLDTGYSEDDLKVIEGQFVPLQFNSIFEYQENLFGELKQF